MKNFGKIALALGVVAGAGLSMIDSIELQAKPEVRMQIWQETNSLGQVIPGGANFTVADKQAARDAFECYGEVTPCAAEVDAVDGEPTGEYIYLSE